MGSQKPASSNVDTLLKDAEAWLIEKDDMGKLEGLIGKMRCEVFSPEGLREAVDPCEFVDCEYYEMS